MEAPTRCDVFAGAEGKIRIELLEEEIVVFSKRALPTAIFFKADDAPSNLFPTLLHRNSTNKGFWALVPGQMLGATGFSTHYFHQVFFSSLDTKIFKEIVNDIEDEVEEIQRVFDE